MLGFSAVLILVIHLNCFSSDDSRWSCSRVVSDTLFSLSLSFPRRWISIAHNNSGLPRPPIHRHPLPSNPPAPHHLPPLPHLARNHQRVPPLAQWSATMPLGPGRLRGNHRGVSVRLGRDDWVRWWGLLQKLPPGHRQDCPPSSTGRWGWCPEPPRPPFLPLPQLPSPTSLLNPYGQPRPAQPSQEAGCWRQQQ